MTIELRELRNSDKNEFLKILQDEWGDFVFAHYYDSLAQNSFENYLTVLKEIPKGKLIPSEHVPATLLFAFNENNELVGRVSIRHVLNEHLLREGGHIGYGVSTRHRRKGYATEILRQSLLWFKKNFPEEKRVLVTCDEGNTASEKTIRKNGGELENIISLDSGQPGKMRFWISIAGQ